MFCPPKPAIFWGGSATVLLPREYRRMRGEPLEFSATSEAELSRRSRKWRKSLPVAYESELRLPGNQRKGSVR